MLSQRALKAINESQLIIGYKTYTKLLGTLVTGKEIISTGMTEEINRVKLAITKVEEGKKVCLISSGDSGVYGMAGLVLELLTKKQMDRIKMEIIPGIIAATACAGLLGAPLMHDFAVISLSDLLTDLELIKRRIELAAKADFVIVLYNPKSKNRITPFRDACNILLKYKSKDTPVGIVRNATRNNEETTITTLKKLPYFKKIDMVTTIIIGNSKTYIKGKYIVTPRGYNLKSNRGRL